MSALKRLGSIEDASLIRKFSVLFILMAVLPLVSFAYLTWQFVHTGTLAFEGAQLILVLVLLGVGVLVGFFGMRSSIKSIQAVVRQTRARVSASASGSAIVVSSSEENEVQELTRTFSDITRHLEENIRRLEESRRTMQNVLSKLAVAIASLENIDTFLDLIVEITTNALEAKTGALMLFDPIRGDLYVKSSHGADAGLVSLRLAVGEEGPGWVAKHKKPLFVPELSKGGIHQGAYLQAPLLCAPMVFQERLVGVLTVAGKVRGGSFGEDELVIISNLASQTAVAVENHRLNEDAEKAYFETISALAMAVEARDPYSRGHSDRVSAYAVKIAGQLGLDKDMISDIKDAARLHDVGKIGISDLILKKPEQLTGDEMQLMRQHSVIGEGIVRPVRSLARLCTFIRHHHEFVDGSGYPDGFKGDQISLGAKILLVADSFDAMTTDRPYSLGMSYKVAEEELSKYSGIRYDKQVVEAFIIILNTV